MQSTMPGMHVINGPNVLDRTEGFLLGTAYLDTGCVTADSIHVSNSWLDHIAVVKAQMVAS
jgi:hypothetical protein